MHSLTSDITGGLMLKVSEGTKLFFFVYFVCYINTEQILSFGGFLCISQSAAPAYVMHSMTLRCPNYPHAKQIHFCYITA